MQPDVGCLCRAGCFLAAILFAQVGRGQEFQTLPPVSDEVVYESVAPVERDWFSPYEFTRYPTDLLWTPPFASKREPRMQGVATTLDTYADPWALDVSIGASHGLLRVARPELDHTFQMDFFAVVHTRLSPEDLIANDYRFGLPLTFRSGLTTYKVAYEHTSAHVGDEGMESGGLTTIHYAKDELVFGLDHWFADVFRPYGQVSWAMWQDLPDDKVSPFRFDVGCEVYDRTNLSWRGVPFLALHADFRGELEHRGNLNVQAGWLWRAPGQPQVRGRLFAEYYHGRSPYGQFMASAENFLSGGIAYDY